MKYLSARLARSVARLASYESRRQKFCRKTRFSRVSQTDFVARLASLTNRTLVARLARTNTNFNSRALRKSARILGQTLISCYELWFGLFMSLANCKTRNLNNISHFSFLARLMRLARLALILSREANLIFHKILTGKIAKRDSLTTLVTWLRTTTCQRVTPNPPLNSYVLLDTLRIPGFEIVDNCYSRDVMGDKTLPRTQGRWGGGGQVCLKVHMHEIFIVCF
jgi:hypothetical protein